MKELQQLLDEMDLLTAFDTAQIIFNWYNKLSSQKKIEANKQLRKLDNLGWLVLCVQYLIPIVSFGWFFPLEYEELIKGTQLEGKYLYRNSYARLRTMVNESQNSNKKVAVYVSVFLPCFEGNMNKTKTGPYKQWVEFKNETRKIIGVYNLYK